MLKDLLALFHVRVLSIQNNQESNVEKGPYTECHQDGDINPSSTSSNREYKDLTQVRKV